MIGTDTSVWFHDHVEDAPCNYNCYEYVDVASRKPWRYFLRINGMLREVHPLTYPSRENRGTVLVKIVNTGEVMRTGNGSLIIDR